MADFPPLGTPHATGTTPKLQTHATPQTQQHDPHAEYTVSSKDPVHYGLRLFAGDPDAYKNYTSKEIGREVRNGKIKFTYTSSHYQPTQYHTLIEDLIHRGVMKTHKTQIEKPRHFTRLTNGYIDINKEITTQQQTTLH